MFTMTYLDTHKTMMSTVLLLRQIAISDKTCDVFNFFACVTHLWKKKIQKPSIGVRQKLQQKLVLELKLISDWRLVGLLSHDADVDPACASPGAAGGFFQRTYFLVRLKGKFCLSGTNCTCKEAKCVGVSPHNRLIVPFASHTRGRWRTEAPHAASIISEADE